MVYRLSSKVGLGLSPVCHLAFKRDRFLSWKLFFVPVYKLPPLQAKIVWIAPAYATVPTAIPNASNSTRFDALHSRSAIRESQQSCWWLPSQMLAEGKLKAPGNPSERVNDMDRWSALALKERKRE